jgi:hypothetical protein
LIAPKSLSTLAIPNSVFLNHANDALMVGITCPGADPDSQIKIREEPRDL